jgi:hypothetical protein
MVRVYRIIVVGRVTGVLLPFDPNPVSSDSVGRAYSVYSFEVERVIAADGVNIGQSIAVMHGGGISDGVAYEVDGDPVVGVGETYLMFLEPFLGLHDIGVPEPWGLTYSGPPYGRFFVSKAGLLDVVDERWLCPVCNAPLVLTGKTIGGADELIKLAASGAPIPSPARLLPSATPPPVPVLTPLPPQLTPFPSSTPVATGTAAASTPLR